jgi:hypothetical protein
MSIGNQLTSDSYRCGNVASILEIDENLRQEYKVFENAPHVSAFRHEA